MEPGASMSKLDVKSNVECIKFDGSNFKECEMFIGGENIDNTLKYPNVITEEGAKRVNVGDYILKEVDKDE